jgi:hypothetical protein
VVYSGTSVYYCGSQPVAGSDVTITIGLPCINNTCPTPTPPGPTPTPTPTPTTGSNYLSQEDLFLILQENGGRIIIT